MTLAFIKENEADTAEFVDLRPYGWAPGEYVFVCRDVDHVPATPGTESWMNDKGFGDKHSSRCLHCAKKRYMLDVEQTKQGVEPVRAPQLTRDKCIPRHPAEECRPVDKAVLIPLLLFKMHDEISEISRDLTNPEEYGDLYEAMLSLAQFNGISLEQIRRAADKKRATKGGLLGGNLWVPDEFMEKKDER